MQYVHIYFKIYHITFESESAFLLKQLWISETYI